MQFVGFAVVVVVVVYFVVTADLKLVGFRVGDLVVKMANVGSLMSEIENLRYLSKSWLNLMTDRLHRLQLLLNLLDSDFIGSLVDQNLKMLDYGQQIQR